MTTPKTEAGREYLDAHRADLHSPGDLPDGPCWCLDSILAIEQEAGRLAVAEASLDGTPAEQLVQLREAIETEWYNGNISQEAHDRLLLPYEWSETLAAQLVVPVAKETEQ